jgi:hypothetical protein
VDSDDAVTPRDLFVDEDDVRVCLCAWRPPSDDDLIDEVMGFEFT